jgi:hypothetical protein
MSRLFVEPKLSIEGLSHCLAWFERQCELSFFQDKEAKLYNKALHKTGNSFPTDIVEAAKMVNAAKRLVQAVNELISRMNRVTLIPEAEAIADGRNPGTENVAELLKQSEDSRKKAENEERNLIELIEKSGADLKFIQMLIDIASRTITRDNWQPSG